MGWAITGAMFFDGVESVDYKGSVVIEWPCGGQPNSVLPSVLSRVLDAETGQLIPAAGYTVHARVPGLITVDVAVFLDDHGKIIYDMTEVVKTTATPATFPFLVREMRTIG